MRRLLCLVFVLSVMGNGVPQPPPVRSARLVWAFYYPWYQAASWNNPALVDYPPLRYTSDSRRAMAWQIAQAQAGGIDGFISSWWGPGDFTDRNLAQLLSVAGPRHFAVSLYFETLSAGKPRDPAMIHDWLAYAIRTYGTRLYQMDGRPVIIIWASETVSLTTWQAVFDGLRREGLDAFYVAMSYDPAALTVFDGLHMYGVFWVPNLAATEALAARQAHAAGKLWAATAQPGYDERRIPDRTGLYRPRDGGAFYRLTMQAALDSDPDWLFITSWNEWYENTYIEPGGIYGDAYLRLTRQLVKAWKAVP